MANQETKKADDVAASRMPTDVGSEVTLLDGAGTPAGKYFVVKVNEDETVDISQAQGGPVLIPSLIDVGDGTVRMATSAELAEKSFIERPAIHSLEDIRRGGWNQPGVAEQMLAREVFMAGAWENGARTVGGMRRASAEYERLVREGSVQSQKATHEVAPTTAREAASANSPSPAAPSLIQEVNDPQNDAVLARFRAMTGQSPMVALAPSPSTPSGPVVGASPPAMVTPQALTTPPVAGVASAGVAGQNGTSGSNPGQPLNPLVSENRPGACKPGCKILHIHQT